MPAQFSVEASIKGAERVSFGYFSAGTAYTRTVGMPAKNSASDQQPTLKNNSIAYSPTSFHTGNTIVFFPSHHLVLNIIILIRLQIATIEY
jgi:hypothetical protein